MFQQIKQEQLTIYQSGILNGLPGIVHGFSSRAGGCSKEPYQELNMGMSCGDDLASVQNNRRAFAAALGILPEQAVCGQQVHGVQIARVSAGDGGRGFLDVSTAFAETDGLVTDQKGIALMTLYADCVPVLFYEPVRQVIAVTHCGWKGTVGKIASRMVDVMAEEYQCSRNEIRAVIGPSISQDAYEVDLPVLERFREAFSFAEEIILPVDETHGKVDLWEANRRQLLEAGLSPEHIEVSGLCTYKNHEIFFSHRAGGGKTGRNAAMLMLK